MSSVAFRLTIYEADGTTPDLTMTSIRSGTNPYIVGVPSGDGQEVDLLTGTVRSGAYNIEVADVVTGSDGTGTVRLVTSQLEDNKFRQQLLSRRAKLEMSRNNGSTWSVWIFGYLTGLRQVDAITYGFTVSDSRRIESTHTAFTWSADANATTDERREFPNRGCLIGGPTLQNFGPLRSSGGWEYLWKEVQGSYLALSFVAAYNAPSFSRNPTMNVIAFFNALRPFFQSLPPVANLTGTNFEQIRERQYVFGFPAIMAIVTSGSSVWYGTVRAAHTPPAPGQNGQGALALPAFGEMNYLYVELDPGQSTSYPSADAPVRVQLLQKEVSSASPLYINEHPVDIVSKLYETVNIPFSASSATTTKALVGDDVRLALRVTEPVNMGQFLAQSIFGPFGFSARTNASGEQEFFATRIANSATPSITITDDDVVGDNPPPVFEVDEASVVTSFRLTAKSLSPFVPDPTGSLQAPPDGLVEVETSQVVQNGDTSTFSTREVTYRFPGMVHDGSVAAAAFTLSPEVVGRFFTGIVAEGFDRFGRGAIASEVQVLSGASAASLQVGDEVLLGIGYYPNKNYRIGESSVGNRIAQIVRRTEAPEGPIFKLIDSGVSAQPTSPTFTLAAFAGDPRREVAVTVTNAATLNTAQVTLAVQYQVSASSPTKTGTLYTRFRPGTIPTVAFTLPKVAPGSTVWVRMRTERTEYRASAWTNWTSQALNAWIPPASLTVGTKTANSVALSWSLGSPTANTIDPLDVFAYKGASAPADWTGYRIGALANGSTSIIVRDLDPSTQYTFGVAFKDEVSGAYSTFATATTTTNAVNTVQAPNAPKMKVYTSFPDAGTTTGVALAIGAVEGYNIVVQRAADSSGSPGAWKEIALLAPLTPIFVDPLPSDGATRWYRVFYRLSGFLDGTPGTARSATPIAIPDELVGQNASIISGGATLTFGSYLVGTPDSFYDGATSQSLAVDATSAATANKVVARDNTGSFSANTVTATLNGPAPAGQLTGDTLAANVITSSLTTVGTIGTGTWQGTSVGKNYGGTGLTSSAFTGVTNERVFAYDGGSGAFFLAPSGSNGQALVYTGGALAWGNPAPGSHVLADTTGLGAQHTTSGLTTGMILQATGATTARFQTPSIPASSVTAGTFSGASYTITNDLTVSGTLTASLPYSSITSKPSYFPADLTSVSGTLSKANGGTSNASWPAANSGEYVVIYDSVTGAERLEAGPQGTTGQALITSGGALTWGNPAPGSHVLATTTGLGAEHTVSGLTSGMILQATGATTARFQTPSIPASSVTAGTFSGTSYTITNDLTVSGTLTGTLTGNITGNAATATKLATARNINGVAFDGTADITVAAAAGTLTGSTLASGVTASSLTSVGTLTNLTVTNTITGSVSGNAGTVTNGVYTTGSYANPSWITSLAGSKISGNISGSAANVTGTVAIANGGTNKTSYTVSGTGTRVLVYDSGTGAFDVVSAGTSGQFLRSSGTAGDVLWATPPTFTSSAAGYAPASGGGTSNFLRADGTWAVPAVGSVSANNVTAGTFPGALYTFSDSIALSGSITFSSDVALSRGAANRLDLATGDSINLVSGNYQIGGTTVLSSNTLGSGITTSSLTSVGTLSALTVSGNTYLATSSGNVGIGTTAPQKKLEVLSLANDFVSVGVWQISVGQWTGIHFGYREGNTSYRKSAIVFERTDLTASDAQGKVHILNGPQASGGSATLADARLTIAENGDIGIGTRNPYNKLTIEGSSARLDLNNAGGASRKALLIEPLGYGGNTYARLESYDYGASAGGFLALNATGGNVGIGATSGAYKLHVTTSGKTGVAIRAANSSFGEPSLNLYDSTSGVDACITAVSGAFAMGTYSSTPLAFYMGNGEAARFDTSRRFLIGTTTDPTTGSFTNTRVLIKQMTDGGSGGGLHIEQSSNTNVAYFGFTGGAFRIGTSYRSTGSYQSVELYSGPTAATSIHLSNSGNFGIGTVSPSAKLTVVGGTTDSSNDLIYTTGYNGKSFFSVHQLGFVRVRSSDLNGAAVHYYDNAGNKRQEMAVSSTALQYYSDAIASTWLYLHNQGRIGINVVPDVAFSVSGAVHIGAAANFVYMGGTAGSVGSWGSRHYTSGGTNVNNANAFTFDNVGYGSTWSVTFTSSGVTASDFILSSDRRRKADLVPITDALAKVLEWAGYTYRPVDGDRRRAGLMAQDVEANAPEVVYTDAEGWKSMSYEQTIPYLVEAIRDLYRLIEARA